MKGKRPRVKIELTLADRLIEIAGWLFLALIWILTLILYSKFPEIIPTHFNTAGEADAHGSRSTIFFLPILVTMLFTGITILNNFPHIFNYPVKITPENALKQYTLATRLLRILKIIIVIIFTVIVWSTGYAAINETSKIGFWLLPFILVTTLAPLFIYIFISYKKK